MNEEDRCAGCGKGGDDLKKCAACKQVKYCSVDCQKSHRSNHKKFCKKQAAILHDEVLFKQPDMEDCSICCLPISIGVTNASYHACCGKTVCEGCMYTVSKENAKENMARSAINQAPLPLCCPFCREPKDVNSNEKLRRVKHRMEMKDPDGFATMGWYYHSGFHGLTADKKKAFELWSKASDLGSVEGSNHVANAYGEGRGVQPDIKKAFSYWEKAAIGGDNSSRHNLAAYEENERGNVQRALKHLMISASGGYNESLLTIREFYQNGRISKEDYESTLRAHKATLDQIWSEQRTEAAAFNERNFNWDGTPAQE
eukprot:scaffold35166_cov73-Cyclotella_meneghiniana.AAC.4